MSRKSLVAKILDPSLTNLGNVGVALVAAARKEQ